MFLITALFYELLLVVPRQPAPLRWGSFHHTHTHTPSSWACPIWCALVPRTHPSRQKPRRAAAAVRYTHFLAAICIYLIFAGRSDGCPARTGTRSDGRWIISDLAARRRLQVPFVASFLEIPWTSSLCSKMYLFWNSVDHSADNSTFSW